MAASAESSASAFIRSILSFGVVAADNTATLAAYSIYSAAASPSASASSSESSSASTSASAISTATAFAAAAYSTAPVITSSATLSASLAAAESFRYATSQFILSHTGQV